MKRKKLKFFIAGLGSMGKRRIRNLQFHGEYQIVGYDTRADRMAEAKIKYGIETVKDFRKLSKDDYDCLIICTPPDKHGDYIRLALKNNKHFFVEHPTSHDGYERIFSNKNRKLVKAPSCTLRFYKPILMIKKILGKGGIGKILTFQYHMGQFLPDWHPWEDYRDVYFSKKETGACREMFAFELIWINWLLGSEVAEVSGYTNKISDLEMDADDVFLANLKYKNGILGNVMIDVISRRPFRTLRILGTTGVLEWERFDSTIKIYNSKSKKSKIIKVPKGRPETGYVNDEEMYNEEIGAFLDAIRKKKKYPYTFGESYPLLKTLYALEKSSRIGSKITLRKL